MGCSLLIYEHVHPFARHQDREYQHDVRFRSGNFMRVTHTRLGRPSVCLHLIAVMMC